MNFIRKLLGTSATDEIAVIPTGKLFLTRSPQSPKGELECLYNDAFALIRRTTSPFCYQLCVTKVYQEGELDGEGSNGFDDSDESDGFVEHESAGEVRVGGGRHSRDEWSFLIAENLKVRTLDKANGTRAITWEDLNGDVGDHFEFIADEEVKLAAMDAFMFAIYKCLYEIKYRTSSLHITSMDQLEEFVNRPDQDGTDFESFGHEMGLVRTGLVRTGNNISILGGLESSEEEFESAVSEGEPPLARLILNNGSNLGNLKLGARVPLALGEVAASNSIKNGCDSNSNNNSDKNGSTPTLNGKIVYECNDFELWVYDMKADNFNLAIPQSDISLRLVDIGGWKYYMELTCATNSCFDRSLLIKSSMNPEFNYQHLSFMFNVFTPKDTDIVHADAWLLRFDNIRNLLQFQAMFVKLMFQSTNSILWSDAEQADQDYVVDAFSRLKINDDEDLTQEDKQELEKLSDDEGYNSQEEKGNDDDEHDKNLRSSPQKIRLQYDDEEDEYGDDDDEKQYKSFRSTLEKNSNLSVGFANDRSYVARGDNLGVFSNDGGNLEYKTTIADMKDLRGKRFAPIQMMLHMRDQNMVMYNKDIDDKKLYKMDLNRGKLVEEWEIDKDIPLTAYTQNSKFSQLTDEQTLTGVSAGGLFKIDPRLPHTKLVQEEKKFYNSASRVQLSSIATTQVGDIAVGSKTGEIRLYNNIGTKAKSLIPSLGEEIIGIDVSANGRWVLATCKTYLLLIDTRIGSDQKHEGQLGFVKPFDKDRKPKPRRLTISPRHASYMAEKTGKPLNFTKAYFNTGLNAKETTIITSSGPYVIMWSLKKVLTKALGDEASYLIKPYHQNVTAENFRFGSNSDMVVALQNDVDMIKKSQLHRPSKRLFNSDRLRDDVVNNYRT